VKELIPNLRENGRLARGWLGVNIVNAPGGPGAVVTEVFNGSPAARAGLRAGDRVMAVNGRTVDNFQQLLRKVSFIAPGSQATFVVLREGREQEVRVLLSERPAPSTLRALAAAGGGETLGLLLREVTADVAQSLSLQERGALVGGVLPGSAAERAGLRAGDLITEVNRKAIGKVQDVRDALSAKGQTALIRFRRGDAIRYVAVEVERERARVQR